jgi:signal recognition particle receptor subunit beta
MPTIDSRHGLLVIRIVYDGPALSGKTTSLKALADGVASRLECPEERDGRTVYFDWMEYVGGLFEGRQICCQIVSVPGQRELAQRRQLLMESADAVVCVLDTRRAELDFGLSWLKELVPYCRGEAPPIGIVLQANKRDAHDAVPRDELRQRIDEVAPIAIVESVATVSDGIREAFVLAVRLALDRVRALSSDGRLELGEPSERGAQGLLEALRQAEAKLDLALAPAPRKPERRSDPLELGIPVPIEHASKMPADDEPERLFMPDPLMPGGMIWPPVDGRALLHEVSGLAIRPARTARGDWWGSGAGWRFHSSPRALHGDPNAARSALIGWARVHAAIASLISAGRAVILADAGAGRLRLWQLVRVEPTLRESLDTALAASAPQQVADGLIDVAGSLVAAREAFAQAKVALPCTLWTVGVPRTARPSYVGLMPMPDQSADTEPEAHALLERELFPHLRALRRTRVDFSEVQRALVARAEASFRDSPARSLAQLVCALD